MSASAQSNLAHRGSDFLVEDRPNYLVTKEATS